MPPKYLFSTLARHLQRAPRFAPILLLLLALMGLSSLGAYQVAQRLGLAEMQATGLHRLDLYAASLEREIGKYAFLPGTLELQEAALDLLAHPAGQKPPNKVNAYLEQLNDRAGTLAIYVINPQGLVLATSNWRRADSYLGENLSFRPYFRDAVAQGSGRFFGIGTTRGEPGYYLASTLVDAHGTQGIAVIKVSLDQLEQSWTTVEAPVLVSDENGVVILGSVPDWKFTTLRTLDEATAKAFDQTQQYNRRALKPLGLRELRELPPPLRRRRIAGEQVEPSPVGQVAADGELERPVAVAWVGPGDLRQATRTANVADPRSTGIHGALRLDPGRDRRQQRNGGGSGHCAPKGTRHRTHGSSIEDRRTVRHPARRTLTRSAPRPLTTSPFSPSPSHDVRLVSQVTFHDRQAVCLGGPGSSPFY